MYVLVYIEYYFWCQLKLFAVVIWISLLAIGYVSIFDKENPKPGAWEQVFLSPNYDVILAPERGCLHTHILPKHPFPNPHSVHPDKHCQNRAGKRPHFFFENHFLFYSEKKFKDKTPKYLKKQKKNKQDIKKKKVH